jgi:hypothetical protein
MSFFLSGVVNTRAETLFFVIELGGPPESPERERDEKAFPETLDEISLEKGDGYCTMAAIPFTRPARSKANHAIVPVRGWQVRERTF